VLSSVEAGHLNAVALRQFQLEFPQSVIKMRENYAKNKTVLFKKFVMENKKTELLY
jgi:hypothetical protein